MNIVLQWKLSLHKSVTDTFSATPGPFFEPLQRGCNISCCYRGSCSQLQNCRQQQGAQQGLNTRTFALIRRKSLHPALSCVLLLPGLMLPQWYLYYTVVILQPRIAFFLEKKQINIEIAYTPHKVFQEFFMHVCDLL